MRRAALAIALALIIGADARAQWCDTWQNDECGANFSLTGVNQLTCTAATVTSLAGVGTRCVETDSNGTLVPAAAACGAGGGGSGTVTTVTGANGVTCSPTSPNPTCTLATAPCGANAFVTGANSGSGLVCTQPNFTNLAGTIGCGQLPPFTHDALTVGGTCAIENVGLTDGGGFDHQTTGSWPNKCVEYLDNFGNITCTSGLTYETASGHFVNQVNYLGGALYAMTNTAPGLTTYEGFAMTNDAGNQSYVYQVSSTYTADPTAPNGLTMLSVAGDVELAPQNTWSFVDDSTKGLKLKAIVAPVSPPSGWGATYIDSTSKTLSAKDDAGNVTHAARTVASSAGVALTGLADNGTWTTQNFQAPLTPCTDYVSVSCQTGATDIGGTNGTTTVIGIENAAAMRGDVVATNVAAPSTPAAGKTAIYVDNGTKNIVALNDGGVKNHGIQNFTCGSSPQQFVKQVGSDGASTCGQASFLDLSGSPTCAQDGATGTFKIFDGGSCGGTAFTTTGSFVAGQPLIATAGNRITTNSLAGITPIQMQWSLNLNSTGTNLFAYICEGGSTDATQTCFEYPWLQATTHVTWSLNITNSTCTGVGHSFTMTWYKNTVASAVATTQNCGTTGVISLGTSSLSVSAGDTVGLVYDGTNWGAAPAHVQGTVTARFDP